MKNADGDVRQGAVPGMVEKTKIALIQQNLNYQKDLNEVAQRSWRSSSTAARTGDHRRHGADLCQRVHRAGAEGSRRPSTSRRWAQKLIERRAARHRPQHGLHELLGPELHPKPSMGAFRAEMRKRGKEI